MEEPYVSFLTPGMLGLFIKNFIIDTFDVNAVLNKTSMVLLEIIR